MRAAHLQDALERLTTAIRDVESELAAMKAEHDPLASHIFVSRYFLLFTPERYTFNGKDYEDKSVHIKDQQIFHCSVPDDKQNATIEASVGKPVEMKVEPFLQHTRYHKTPVLFTVLSVKVLEGAINR